MSSGTWVLLCRDEQCYTTNETGWHHVRGSVVGSTLTIDCEEVCDDTVSWMVVACRKDQHMLDDGTVWTDDQGYPIIEPLKVAPEPDPSVEEEILVVDPYADLDPDPDTIDTPDPGPEPLPQPEPESPSE